MCDGIEWRFAAISDHAIAVTEAYVTRANGTASVVALSYCVRRRTGHAAGTTVLHGGVDVGLAAVVHVHVAVAATHRASAIAGTHVAHRELPSISSAKTVAHAAVGGGGVEVRFTSSCELAVAVAEPGIATGELTHAHVACRGCVRDVAGSATHSAVVAIGLGVQTAAVAVARSWRAHTDARACCAVANGSSAATNVAATTAASWA